jgi:Ice-binding-like
MNRFGSLFKPLMWFMALLLTAFVAGCGGGGDGGGFGSGSGSGLGLGAGGGGVGGLGRGPAPVDLLSVSTNNFVILTETGITNTGSHTSVITGNIGSSPITAAAMNNVFCSEITGTIFGVDAAYVGSGSQICFMGNPPPANKTLVDNAVADMVTAYNDAAGRTVPAPITELGAGDISGKTLVPGLYKWSSGVVINTDVTLSGGANDVWIFQIAQNLTVANGIKVILAGGAQAKNVFWQDGGSVGVAIGTTAHIEGTILAAKAITLATGSVVTGRLLAQSAVTLDATTVTHP